MKHSDSAIAVYSRKSRFTGKGESIGNQVELCRRYIASSYGDEAVENIVIFEDEGFSGSNLNRPAFQDMVTQVRENRFRAVVVYRVDRISRNIGDFANLMDELTRLDVAFVSIREQFDTATPMGRAMMYIISIFSQLERETIAERIRDNMHELARTGRWLGGNTPTGYASESVTNVTVDGKSRRSCYLRIIPEEARIVRMIFDLYIQLDSLTAVEGELLRRGIHTKQGNEFTRFSIRAILQNPVYMVADETAYRYFTDRGVAVCSGRTEFDGTRGVMPYNRTGQEKGKPTVFLPMESWIVAVGRHPGLVPSPQWCAVQQALERNKSKTYRQPRRNEALLTGLLYCACGERMYPKLTRRRTEEGTPVFSYVCKRKERSRKALCSRRNADGNGLDRTVAGQVSQLPEDKALFAERMKKSCRDYSGSREDYEELAVQLRQEQAEVERKIDGLIDSMALVADSPARGRVLERIEKLTEENGRLELRIRELEGIGRVSALEERALMALARALAVFQETFGDMETEEKRGAIRAVVSKVVWDGENARVVLLGAEKDDEMAPKLPEGLTRLCEGSK